MKDNGNSSRTIIVDADKCTGCKVCELVCSMKHYGEYNPKKSFIRVLMNKEAHVNIPVLEMNCDFCGTCVHWCPANALSIAKTGDAISMRKDSKIGMFPIPRA